LGGEEGVLGARRDSGKQGWWWRRWEGKGGGRGTDRRKVRREKG
jgi:hypothetical protein